MESVQGRPRLRSASTRWVELPRVRTSVDQRSFNFYRPTVSNRVTTAVCCLLCATAAYQVRTFGRHLFESYEHHLSRLWCLAIQEPPINVITYLVTTIKITDRLYLCQGGVQSDKKIDLWVLPVIDTNYASLTFFTFFLDEIVNNKQCWLIW